LIKRLSDWLARLFIDDYQAIDKNTVRAKYGIMQGWISIGVNLLLGIAKLIVGLLISSIALIADAVHSLSDMATSLILIISFHWGQKPSDEDHPFGHGRLEQIGALVMAVLIGVTGFELIKSGIERIITPAQVQSSVIAIVLLLLTIVIKEILGRISNYYGTMIKSISLEADSWHHRTDALSSALVIISILATQAGIRSADGIGGIIIGIFIIYIGVDITVKTSFQLMGTHPSAELYREIESQALQVENVHAVHDIISHEYGAQKVVSFHLEVPNYLKLSEAHAIAEEVEGRIKNELHIQATVHLDPVLPVIKNQSELRRLLATFIGQNDFMENFFDLRLIGDESESSLVLGIQTNAVVSEESREKHHAQLRKIISTNFPEIIDVYINFIPAS